MPKSAASWSCLAVVLVPFALSFCFTTPPTASAVTGERAHASLVFDEYMVNFGPRPISQQRLIEIPFRYRNVSTKEIQVQSLTPSCGCLRPTIDSMTIKPGETGRLLMPIDTLNEAPGPHEYLVKVLYTDTKPRELDLALKVVLPPKTIDVQPKAMWFYHSGEQPTPQQVTITDYRSTDFEIRNITSSSTLWAVNQLSDARTIEGSGEIKLEVTLKGDVAPGTHRGVVIVTTDDTKFPYIQIPVGCQAMNQQPATATILAEPDTLVLRPTPDGALLASTQLRGPGGNNAATIASVKAAPSFFKAELVTNDQYQTIVQVSAELTDAQRATPQRGVVTIRSKDGAKTALTIPVVVHAANPPE